MPIGDVESKLLDPVPFVSSATPIEDAAHQIVTSPSGKSVQPNKVCDKSQPPISQHQTNQSLARESLGRKSQRTHLVGSEDPDDDYNPGSSDESDDSDDSDLSDAPGLDDGSEAMLTCLYHQPLSRQMRFTRPHSRVQHCKLTLQT
jgi:hypothetical protein